MIIKSPLLDQIPGLCHGFSTRLGGVSEGPFRTLNLALHQGKGLEDSPKHVCENERRFLTQANFGDAQTLSYVRQIHGTTLREARPENALSLRSMEGDGVLTRSSTLVVAVRTADCAPVLLAGRAGNGPAEVVAAVHAGWRGAAGGILRSAVQSLVALGVTTEGIHAAIGPTIGPDRFEVGVEVVEAAAKSLEKNAVPCRRGPEANKFFLDLPRLVELQLEEAGVHPSRIERLDECTYSNPALYFSYRREQGVTGRHLSAIALKP